ncbi:DMT family transporter [Vibrio sonorensis]|uniref:DMT family transporter n=1 Tax=Vibrio sonorensis TaxID=1004316 RepID=UPI0008DA7499|nr:DMT family transporter [Vibrio sonorensis]
MSYSLYPILFMLSSTLSLALTGLVTKWLTLEITLSWLVFLRFFLPAALLVLVVGRKLFILPSKGVNRALYARAICIASCQFCFVYALERLTLVESVVLFGTGPLFIPLLEKLIYGIKLNMLTLLTLAMTFLGVILLAGNVSGIEFRPELLVGLAAGVFNGGSQVTLYRASQGDSNAAQINFWTFLYATIAVSPLLILSSPSFLEVNQHSSPIVLLAGLLIMAGLIINTQIFRSKAYALADSGSQLAPLIFTNLLFTAVLQFSFYDTVFSVFQVAGMSMIVFANGIAVFLPKWLKNTVWLNRVKP